MRDTDARHGGKLVAFGLRVRLLGTSSEKTVPTLLNYEKAS